MVTPTWAASRLVAAQSVFFSSLILAMLRSRLASHHARVVRGLLVIRSGGSVICARGVAMRLSVRRAYPSPSLFSLLFLSTAHHTLHKFNSSDLDESPPDLP